VSGYRATAWELQISIPRSLISGPVTSISSESLSWPATFNRRQREASCHLLPTDTWHRDTSLGAMLEQKLICQCWLRGGLVCIICFSCAMYTSKWK
jgi:hypothetical protein